jgi:hypothetical protein
MFRGIDSADAAAGAAKDGATVRALAWTVMGPARENGATAWGATAKEEPIIWGAAANEGLIICGATAKEEPIIWGAAANEGVNA